MKSRAPHAYSSPKRRRWPRIAAVALPTLAAVILVAGYLSHTAFPGPTLTELVIPSPLSHVQPQAVRAAVLPALGNGFFTTNVEQIQAAVQAVPWVASAAVRRSWPHTLYIDISEEVPVARWNGSGLMDAQGRVFVQASGDAWAKLPLLSGSEGSEHDVLDEFNVLSPALTAHGLALKQLSVNARGDAGVELNDDITVRLGRSDAELRIERFVTVALPTLSKKLPDVAYVDMRYTNGFAVGWSRGIAATCHRHVAPAERRHKDVADMDGSQSCALPCAAAGQLAKNGSQGPCTTANEVQPNG